MDSRCNRVAPTLTFQGFSKDTTMKFLLYSIPKNQLNSAGTVTMHELVNTPEEAQKRFEELAAKYPDRIVNYREVTL
jgi:hypothetical protein